MERWMMYGLVAAIFIALRDVFSKDLINRYDYTDYIIDRECFIIITGKFNLFICFKKEKLKFRFKRFIYNCCKDY